MRRLVRKSDAVLRAEAARILGVTVTTVRRYEAEGRLSPTRNERGEHVFARRAVELLAARRRRAARAKETREVVLTERDVARLAAALGFDAKSCSAAIVVERAEHLRALVRQLRAGAAAR